MLSHHRERPQGTAQGKGVPWGRLGYGVWPPPLVNYCRGFDMLTRKGKMQSTLEQGSEQFEGAWQPGMPKELTEGAAVRDPSNVWDLCPPSFVFHPSKTAFNSGLFRLTGPLLVKAVD